MDGVGFAKVRWPLASDIAVCTLCRTAAGKVLPTIRSSKLRLEPIWATMGQGSQIWKWSSWTGTPIREFWRAYCPIRMILTKFVTKTVPFFYIFPPFPASQSLQPSNSCFTLTKRMCQLMASDKSSEAPVHTFSRWRQTWAREPRAKHLSQLWGLKVFHVLPGPIQSLKHDITVNCSSAYSNNFHSWLQVQQYADIHHNIIRLIYHTSVTPRNDYRPNDSRLWPSRPIQLGTFGIRDLTRSTPKNPEVTELGI